MAEKACMKCMRIIMTDDKTKKSKDADEKAEKEEICEMCNSGALSEDWSGLVIILDPRRSEIAQKMGVDLADKYALKVR